MYPQLLWERLEKYGVNAVVIAFEEETKTDWLSSINPSKKVILNVGQIGKLFRSLKQLEVRYTLLAGQITPGKLFKDLRPDLKALRILFSLKEKNASTIFGAIVQEMETKGTTVLDARCFLDDQLAHEGVMVESRGVKFSESSLQQGISVAKELARLEVGQGLVIYNGTIIAVEAFEGTDNMIERAGRLCSKPMGFIKTSKPGQDFRFDVPVFGLRTVEKMKEAGIGWAALEAEKTLILNKEETLRTCAACGIKLIGYK